MVQFVTAISGLVAEVQQQMDATHAQNQQRQEAQDDHARPYTNGTILHNTGPVHIVTSEYREASKEKSPEPQNVKPESVPEVKESSSEKATKESLETQDELSVKKESDEVPKISQTEQSKSKTDGDQQKIPEGNDLILSTDVEDEKVSHEAVPSESGSEPELIEIDNKEDELMRLTSDIDESDGYVKVVQDFLNEESKAVKEDKQSTLDLLEEAIKEDLADKIEDDQENASVKVVGMEVTAHTVDGGAVPRAPPPALHTPAPHRPHEAEEVKSIYLETEIPQKSRVLVTDFAEDRPEDSAPASSSPMVVSGKMTLSLIQDAPRDTPERDPESTVDDFTTASAITQPALDKQAEESEEEIEIEEEIVEIVEDEEIEEIEQDEEDIPLVSKPVKVVEEIKVTEPVQVTESVKEEMVGAVADDSKDIEELVEVTEPVKWSEEIDVEEEITEVDVKDELFQVSDPEKASAPAEEIQELEVEDKAAKVTEQLKWSEEASVEDSKEIEEFENEPVETSNTVKEAAPEEVLEELEVENEPIRVTEISKWPEEAGAEEEVQELEIEDTPVKETESLKWSEEADTKDSEEHEEQGNKLIEVTKSLKEADPDEEVEELEIEDKTVNGVESLKLSKEAATNDSEEIEVHDQLIKVTEPVKEAAPVQEVQELEIEDKPVKVVESLKWSDEAATNDSEEIVERDNELINVTEPVEEAVPIEDVKNEPVKPTEPMKWSEQVAAEVSEEIELYDDERAQIVEPIKEPQKEQEKAEVQEFEIKDKLVKVTEPEKSSEKSSPKEEAQALELKDEQVTVVPEPIKWSEEVAAEDTEDAINKVPVKLTESLKSSTDAATEEETQEGQGNEAAKVTETVKPKKKGKKKKSGGKERNNVAKGSKE